MRADGGGNNAKSESDRSIDWTCSSAANPALSSQSRRDDCNVRAPAAVGGERRIECVKPTTAVAVAAALRRPLRTMKMKIALARGTDGRTSAVAVALGGRARESRVNRSKEPKRKAAA